MKIRKPVLVWLFPFLTGGIYLIYWLFSLIEEINAYKKSEKINFKKTVINFSVVFSLFIILLSVIVSGGFSSVNNSEFNPVLIVLFFICWILGVCWFVLIAKTVYKAAVELQEIQVKNNVVSPIEPVLSVILFFLYFSGVIYLQSHINKTVKITGEEKINTQKSKKIAMAFGIVMFIFIFNAIFGFGRMIKNITAIQNKEPVISIDLLSYNKNERDILFINNPGQYALWVDCDFEYYTGFSPLIEIKILQNEIVIFNKQYNPLNAPLRINTIKKTINNRTNMRFRGRLDKINLEIGEYKIIVNNYYDDKLIKLNKYLFYMAAVK